MCNTHKTTQSLFGNRQARVQKHATRTLALPVSAWVVVVAFAWPVVVASSRLAIVYVEPAEPW